MFGGDLGPDPGACDRGGRGCGAIARDRANPGNERSGAPRRTTQTLGESARASKDMSPVIHGTLRGPDAGQISLRQPFGAARQSKGHVQRQSAMHLMVEHASLGAAPVKPKAAGGGGLKGQALRRAIATALF
jgi:hypothetical protein